MASSAPDLDNTSERQAALRRYHILDTPPEKEFDRITSLASKACDAPTALITLIDEERQWFKSCFGFETRETDVGLSFCVHAVHQGEMLVVEDATADPRFRDNPLVTEPPHVRFYAGAPLTTPDGIHIGTLCIFDYEARTFDAAQREVLEQLAEMVVDQFEHRSAEAQAEQLIDENPQPMIVYARDDGTVLDANEAAQEQYGYDARAFRSVRVDKLKAPPNAQPSSDALSMHERKDGSLVPVRVREKDILFDGKAACLAVPQPVSSSPDSDRAIFFGTDLDGTVQSLSHEWEAATNFPIADTVGTPLPDLVHSADRAAIAEAFSALLDGTTGACQRNARFVTDHGNQAFALYAQPVRDDSGAAVGVAGTLTPLLDGDPTVSGPAANTADDTDPSDPYDVFAADLPTFSDGTNEVPPSPDDTETDAPTTSPSPPSTENEPSDAVGERDLSPEPFDFVTRVHTVLDQHADASSAVDLRRALPDDSLPVRLDPAAVETIVDILVENALSHTESGTVTVRTEASNDTVTLHVVDTGSDVEARFMEVYMDEAGSQDLGLHHVHQLARRLGGSMNMENAEHGTHFALTLPRSSPSHGEGPASTLASGPSPTSSDE